MSGGQEADSWREVIAKARSPFVRKLWMMLHTAELAPVISFDADGTSFSIHDTNALQATVLPKWFKSALLKTFQVGQSHCCSHAPPYSPFTRFRSLSHT